MKSTTSTICSDCNEATGEQKHHHKHIWMYSTYCDTCNCDFDTWLQEEKEKVVHSLVLNDFNHMLFEMCDEGKIDRDVSVEIYHKMRELARAKGFLKLPWESESEKQQQREGEGGEAWLTE
jgi:hypothetical protein